MYHDPRRLAHRLSQSDFDALRGESAFDLLLLDLAFPDQVFAKDR